MLELLANVRELLAGSGGWLPELTADKGALAAHEIPRRERGAAGELHFLQPDHAFAGGDKHSAVDQRHDTWRLAGRFGQR
jgi:hypothetical protein